MLQSTTRSLTTKCGTTRKGNNTQTQNASPTKRTTRQPRNKTSQLKEIPEKPPLLNRNSHQPGKGRQQQRPQTNTSMIHMDLTKLKNSKTSDEPGLSAKSPIKIVKIFLSKGLLANQDIPEKTYRQNSEVIGTWIHSEN